MRVAMVFRPCSDVASKGQLGFRTKMLAAKRPCPVLAKILQAADYRLRGRNVADSLKLIRRPDGGRAVAAYRE